MAVGTPVMFHSTNTFGRMSRSPFQSYVPVGQFNCGSDSSNTSAHVAGHAGVVADGMAAVVISAYKQTLLYCAEAQSQLSHL